MKYYTTPHNDFLYVPASFSPDILPEELRRYADPAHRFLDLVVRKSVRYKSRPWHPLQAKTLREIVHKQKTEAIREALVKLGFISCDYHYEKGKKCFHYQLGARSRGEVVRVRAKPKRRSPKRKTTSSYHPTHGFLYQDLDREVRKVRIDYEAALDHLGRRHRRTSDVYWIKKLSLDVFRWGDHCLYSVDGRGRVYTSVSNLWREFRQFLSYDGEELVEIDVANCQPLLFSSLLLNHYKHQPPLPSTPSPSMMPQRGISTNGVDVPNSANTPSDVTSFIRHCERGTLYTHLIELFQMPISRGAFKRRFFTLFYSRNESTSRYKQLFGRYFSNVYQFAHDLKQSDYRHLSHLIQRQEADLMIGRVASRLLSIRVPTLTIHDAILTTPQYADVAQRIIKSEFGRLGLQATVKITRPQCPAGHRLKKQHCYIPA